MSTTTLLLAVPSWTTIIMYASIQVSTLFVAVALITSLLRRSSAAIRHRIWSLAFCSVFLVPLLSTMMPQWMIPIFPPDSAASTLILEETAGGRRGAVPEAVGPGDPRRAASSDAIATTSEPSNLPSDVVLNNTLISKAEQAEHHSLDMPIDGSATLEGMLIVLWAVGFAVFSLHLLQSALHKRRLMNKARQICSEEWDALLRELCLMLGMKRTVRVFRSREENVPMTWSIFHPLIMLPVSSSQWTQQRRRFVLLHELAHIDRLDLLFQVLAHVGCALHWFNPIVWYGYSRLRIECEHACDDCVIHQGGRASDYAAELLNIAKAHCTRPVLAAVGMARTNQLEQRIQFLFDRARSHLPLTRGWQLGSLAVASLLILSAAMIHPVQRSAAADEPVKRADAALFANDTAPRSTQGPQNASPLTKTDSTGDPLPTGARARLESTRWRHKSAVALARFSPDGKILATAGTVDTIRLWDVATGKQLHELTETGRWQIYGVVFSQDGTKLTSIQQGGVIRLWDVATGKQVCAPQKHPGEAYERYGIACSPDGKIIATAGAKDVHMWDAASLKVLKTFPTGGPKGNDAPGIAFSPDGNLLAASSRLDIHLWNLKTGQIDKTIPAAHAEGVTSLVFAPDSETLISGGKKGHEPVQIGNRGGGSSAEIAIWQVATGQRVVGLMAQSFDSGLYSLALSADGTVLVSGHHNEARVWNLETRTLTRIIDREYSVHGGYPCTLDLSPDGKWLAARTDRNSIGLWNVETGELSENSETHRQSITSIASTRDSKTLVTSASEDAVRLWDPTTGKQLGQTHMNSRGTGFSTIAITPDDKIIAAGGGYRLMSGQNRQLEFKGNLLIGNLSPASVLVESSFSDVIGSLVYSPDGKTLAATTNNRSEQTDEAILIIDPDDGTARERLSGHAGEICLIAFSVDGKTLYSVANDKKLRDWDIEAAKVTRTVEITGHEGPNVSHAAFSRDSKRFATCEMFGKVLVITDVTSGKRIREIVVPDTLGNLLAISADGQTLASACQPISDTDTRFDERIHLWDIATGQKLFSFDASTDGTVATLCLLPDGKTLVSGMDRGTALLWDISNIRTQR